ncbi:MAG: hypothetical protein ACI4TK_03665 [Agathobacter sp.]
MNERIEAYLTTHPRNRTQFEQLYELIDRLNKCHNSNLTITTLGAVTVISHTKNPKVDVAFFTYNNIDHPTLLIRGNRAYSFEPSDIKDINVEQLPDSAGMRYTLHLALSDAEYTMQFDLPGDTAER